MKPFSPKISWHQVSVHPNCKPHNWLLYEIGHAFMERFKCNFKGHLYDLGCGEMPYKEWLLNHVDTYTGVDWSNTLHTLKADIVADLNSPLPIENNVADTVVSFSVLEHLCEPQQFLSESYRILKPSGSMVLQVPFMWWVHEAPYDFFRYTRYGLKYMFEKAGFKNVEVYPQTGFWVMLALKFNYQIQRIIRGPWLFRLIPGCIVRVIWAITQTVAPWLDKQWKCEEETAGYFVLAHKPI